MIQSGLFSKSTLLELGEQLPAEVGDADRPIHRSTLYHLLLSFATFLNNDANTLRIEKYQVASEFGQQIGSNITEEESLGNIKYFIAKSDKDKGKAFLGQFKFLNVRVWPTVFGSSSKLFAIVGEGGGYKLEDKDFGLTRWISGPQDQTRALKKLLLEVSRGILEGFLSRFQLSGEVSYNQVGDNHINFELKQLCKKSKVSFK